MSKLVVGCLLVMMPVSVLSADLVLGGYFEPQFTGTYLDNRFRQLNSNKLRIDLSCELTDNITFTGNFNYLNYNGQREWNLLDYLPANLVATVPDSFAWLYSYTCKDEGELDNAYVRFYGGRVTLTAGRQQISVGSGYAFNPTDIFNRKDLLDPTYEQPAVNGLRVDIGLMREYIISVFYSPEATWRQSGKMLRLQGGVSHFDLALLAGQRSERHTDYVTFDVCEQERVMLGIDLNGELFGIGCWSENAYNFVDISTDYRENLVGVDYTFSSGWYLMAEYYHNSQGKKNSDAYTLNDWMKYFTTESKTISRDQLYTHTFYPLTDLVTIGASGVFSISDQSLLLIPTCEYSIGDDVTLTLFGNIYTGREGTMYSRDLGSGGIVRLRVYF
ncbi:MAG: hypothetical protein KAT58_07740 [candidate division Zixibacteria bacterium]|nr:hypothetical protein [candidate division Zixibacteria bacterium]